MTTVTQQELLIEIELAAREESVVSGYVDHAMEDFVDEAKSRIEELFTAIVWTRVENGLLESYDSISKWQHRCFEDVEKDWLFLSIDRKAFQEAAEFYLDNSWMTNTKIDWLILNILTYAELLGTLELARSRILSPTQIISFREKSIKCNGFTSDGYFFLNHLPLLNWWQWNRKKAAKIVDPILGAMFKTYSALNTKSNSWEIVWQELNESRNLGVVWDGIVYRLLEERRKAFKKY